MLVRSLNLVSGFPDLKQADRRVKPIKDCQRHRNVRDNSPSPVSEELQMSWPKLCSVLLQGVDSPHGHVGYNQKRNQFPSRFSFGLFSVSAAPPPTV